MRARWEGPQRLALETGAARAEGSTNRKDAGGTPTTSAASCPAPGPWDPFDPIRCRPLLSGSETLPPASGAAIGGGPGPPLPVLRSEPQETPPSTPAPALGRLSRSASFQTGLLSLRLLSRNQGRRRQRRRFHVPVIDGSWHLCCPRRHGLRSCGMRALSPWSLTIGPRPARLR